MQPPIFLPDPITLYIMPYHALFTTRTICAVELMRFNLLTRGILLSFHGRHVVWGGSSPDIP
jgi:hypothetical protein